MRRKDESKKPIMTNAMPFPANDDKTILRVEALLASLCATGFAVPSRASENTALAQIDLIFKNFDSCRQNENDGTWFYTVTDLDHNGRLELLAASVQGANCIPAAKFWEVSVDGRSRLCGGDHACCAQ